MVLRFTVMEKKLTNSGPLMESTSKHSIYPPGTASYLADSQRLTGSLVDLEGLPVLDHSFIPCDAASAACGASPLLDAP